MATDDRGYGRPDDYPRSADERARAERDERGFFDRATDEVRTWFGDDDAERRRARDERDERGYDDRDYGRRERAGDYDRFAERRRQESIGARGFSGYTEGGTFTGRRTGSGNDFARGYISDENEARFDGGRSGFGRRFRPSIGGFGPDEGRSDRYQGYGSETGGNRRTSFRGRGPQGYSRATERIAEDVNEALTHDHEVDATNITVSVDNGEVTLTGTVESRYEKRAAERVAEDVRGVRDVHNQLRVQDGTTTVGTSGAGSSGAGSSAGAPVGAQPEADRGAA